ncbi:hypothetical protein GEMRC1_012438 [Eukaryota sp. GEM-RC1]
MSQDVLDIDEIPASPILRFKHSHVPSFTSVPGFDENYHPSSTSDPLSISSSNVTPLFSTSSKGSKLMAQLGYVHGVGLGPLSSGIIHPIKPELSTEQSASLDHLKSFQPSLSLQLLSIKSFKRNAPMREFVDRDHRRLFQIAPVIPEGNENVEVFEFFKNAKIFAELGSLRKSLYNKISDAESAKERVQSKLISLEKSEESVIMQRNDVEEVLEQLTQFKSIYVDISSKINVEVMDPEYIFKNVIDFLIFSKETFEAVYHKFSLSKFFLSIVY